MSEIPPIVLPHGGYRNLIVYRKSDVIYQGTVVFCRRFLPKHGDRTVDQMTQAARSCKQNIAEGSAASGTSKETELKLTNVARATLDELCEDYLDYLKTHERAEWDMRSREKAYARNFAREHCDWSEWKAYCESRPAEVVANLMIVVIQQAKYLLDKMIARQEADFKKFGGVRERMHAARTAAHGESWEKVVYSRLDATTTDSELAARAAEIKASVDKAAWSLKKRKGWS